MNQLILLVLLTITHLGAMAFGYSLAVSDCVKSFKKTMRRRRSNKYHY